MSSEPTTTEKVEMIVYTLNKMAETCPDAALKRVLAGFVAVLSEVMGEVLRMERHMDRIVADAVAEERLRFAMLQRSEIVKFN
jgi:hypothetical protein